MSKRTDAYVMTAHTKSAGDMLEIETIRKSVISINKINKRKKKLLNTGIILVGQIHHHNHYLDIE